MYLPLAGINPDSDRLEKMKINSAPPILPHKIVQPATAADSAQQQLEKVHQEKLSPTIPSKSEDKAPSLAEEHHWSAPPMSTQDFVSLKQMGGATAPNNDDDFKVLDEVIASLKERVEATGELVEAIKKMQEQADPDNIALQILTKTLEAMDSSSKSE